MKISIIMIILQCLPEPQTRDQTLSVQKLFDNLIGRCAEFNTAWVRDMIVLLENRLVTPILYKMWTATAIANKFDIKYLLYRQHLPDVFWEYLPQASNPEECLHIALTKGKFEVAQRILPHVVEFRTERQLWKNLPDLEDNGVWIDVQKRFMIFNRRIIRLINAV